MAAAISTDLDIETELIRGGKGIFDVIVDGQNIYSKYETGRFPEDEEVLAQLRDRAPALSA